MIQLVGPLPPTSETWIEFSASGFSSQAGPWLLGAFSGGLLWALGELTSKWSLSLSLLS